jgi:hypothetical protein
VCAASAAERVRLHRALRGAKKGRDAWRLKRREAIRSEAGLKEKLGSLEEALTTAKGM